MIVNDSIDFANGIFKANGNYGYPLLKCLVIDGNSKMTHLIENGFFTSLEWLGLRGMMLLESIVPKHSPTNSFNNLKVLKIIRCEKLKNIFSFCTFKDLSNLQIIEVESCDLMDGIVSVENEDQKTICTSPLTSLYIRLVNKLTSFCTKLPQLQQSSQTLIPFFDQQVSFPELKNLSIVRGNNLEVLWLYNNGLIGSSFSKLQSINIQRCNKLRCMFPSNIVASLVFLDTLRIHSCELLEEIFEIEKSSTFGDTKVVPLRVLNIYNLPNLKYVWNKDDVVGDVFAFPNLKEVSVEKCPKLKTNFPDSEQFERLEVDVQNEVFVVDEEAKLGKVVLFRSLRRLKMSCKQATNKRFWIISEFPQLQNLSLVGCEEGHDEKVFSLPIEMSKVLNHIENFEIRGCFYLLQVFGNAHIQRCANLKSLTLLSLPKLARVFDPTTTAITFLNLVGIEVDGCNEMINFFSSSVAKNLVNLDSLKISNCTGMTSIVALEEENDGEIVFNKLTRLRFDNLPRLACFHSGKCALKFPILNTLKISRCDEMKTFSYGITNSPSLQSVTIGAGGDVPVSLIQGINDIIQAFFTKEIESLHGMKNMVLSLKSVKRIRFWHEHFSELGSLTLIGSEDDDDVVCLPLEMSEVLYNIGNFEIQNALELTQVFQNQELLSSGNNDTNHHIQRCAKLVSLYLCDLPKLTHLWKESSEEKVTKIIRFDSLEYISVKSCSSLKCVLPSSVSFLNLDALAIYDCNGMMNLFSSSVAKNLGNLRTIEIADCTEMTSIVVAAEEENGELCLKKLDYIQLYNLPKLATFHSGKCTLKFPSLVTLHVQECNAMETFLYGTISTPKLRSFSIGGRKFQSLASDINVIIEDVFAQRNRLEESMENCED